MSAFIGIVIACAVLYVVYAGRVKVLASKRYRTRQTAAPDLSRFSETGNRQPSGEVNHD
ncbi:MAG TPA: hypothetical protein VE991_10565 [Acidimicrobiales bacterium]|nr:hypothetical protein [Acidimicrobiales bacterium]